MIRRIAVFVSALLLSSGPALGGTLQIYEDSLGGPGVTAEFPTGNGQVADIDFDADSAEGGSGLPFGGPGEIDIRPTGSLIFVAFSCQLAGCSENDYIFTPGGQGTGLLRVTDPNSGSLSGIYELGDLTFDAASLGTIDLLGCNYADGNGTAQTCDPFTLVQTVPEPTSGALLGFALIGLAFARRRHH